MSTYWNTDKFEFENYHITQLQKLPENCDVLISFINREERAMGLFSMSNEELKNIREIHLIIFNKDLDRYEDEILDQQLLDVKSKLEDKDPKLLIHFLNFYSDTFSSDLFSILSTNNIFDSQVLFDITNIPSAAIIPFGEMLIGHLKHKLTISYMLPDAYDTVKISEIDKEESQTGTLKIYGVNELKNPVLAILAGFEDVKAHRIAEEIDPKNGYLMNNIFSKEIHEMGRAMETMSKHQDLISLSNYMQFNLPRYDTNRILNSFKIVQNNHPDSQFVIAPLSSKIQKVAALLFVSRAPNRGLIDIIPTEMSFRRISSGLKDKLFYQISRTDIKFHD